MDFVYVQSLSAYDREVCFRILTLTMDKYGQGVLDDDGGIDLDILEYGLASMDGEKDPRCLIQGFRAMKSIIMLYSRQSEYSLASGQLEERVEELFDVLSCYFPVDFTPPPNDQHGITRDDIAKELQDALASSQLFTDLIVPLVTDKLSSLLNQAKLDSLCLLEACVKGYEAAAFKDHVATLWLAIRPELRKWGDKENAELSKAVWRCLHECFRAFGVCSDIAFARLVLDDSNIMRALNSATPSAPSHEDLATGVRNCCIQLGSLASSGSAGAQLVVVEALVPLVDFLNGIRQGENTSTTNLDVLAWAAASFLCHQVSVGDQTKSEMAPYSAWHRNLESFYRLALLSADYDLSRIDAVPSFSTSTSTSTSTSVSERRLDEILESEGSFFLPREEDLDALSAAAYHVQIILQMKALDCLVSSHSTARLLRHSDAIAIVNALVPFVEGIFGSRLYNLATSLLQALVVGQHFSSVVETQAIPRLLDNQNSQQRMRRQASLDAIVRLSKARPERLLSISMLPLLDSLLDGLGQISKDTKISQNECDALMDIADSIAMLMQEVVVLTAEPEGVTQDISAAQMSSQRLGKEIYMGHVLGSRAQLEGWCNALLPKLERIIFLGTAMSSMQDQMVLSSTALSELARQDRDPVTVRTSYCVLMALSPEGCDASFTKDQDMERLSSLLMESAVNGGEVEAADTLGCILNKLGDEKGAEDAAQRVVDACIQNLESVERNSSDATKLSTLRVMTSITRALAMRGSKRVHDFVSRLVEKGLILCLARKNLMDTQTLTAMGDVIEYFCDCARIFGAVVQRDGETKGPSNDDHQVATNTHCTIRPLWQQRTFVFVLKSLTRALHEMATVDGGTPQKSRSLELLTLTLAQVLVNVPSSVLHVHIHDAVMWVLHCLVVMSSTELILLCRHFKMVLSALLKVLFELMGVEQGRQEAGLGLPRLMPALVSLAGCEQSMETRDYSFRCLIRMTSFPFNELFPYKKMVLAAATKGTDDKKRRVRKVAVACREAWMHDITPNMKP